MATIMLTPPRTRRSGRDDAIEALREGDERRFVELVTLYQPLMSRLARALVPTARQADDLVRAAWVDVLADLDMLEKEAALPSFLVQRLMAHAPAWRDGATTASHAVDPLRSALLSLPTGPYVVVSLRDVEGWSAEEVSDTLGLSHHHQRRLLHQGRSAIHQALYGGHPAAAS